MIFEFVCNSCTEVLRIESPIGKSPDVGFCSCGGDYQRVWSPLGTRYRCSGFYQTDKVLSDLDKRGDI